MKTFFVIGSPTCGRRGIVFDIVKNAMSDGDFCGVFIAESEAVSDFDRKIAASELGGVIHYKNIEDAAAKISALDPNKFTYVVFLGDASKNLADQVEDFKKLYDDHIVDLARIWGVVDCRMLSDFPEQTRDWLDAVSHFSDCLILTHRSNIPNSVAANVKMRYDKMCRPHEIYLADKNFQVDKPMAMLVDEARRICMVFDDIDAVDELDLDEENLPEEPFDLQRKPDPYLERLENGMRAKPIPEVGGYAKEARIRAKEDV